MNLKQATLYARITNYVKGVGEMVYNLGIGAPKNTPGCWLCEAERAGIIEDTEEMRAIDWKEVLFSKYFGVTINEAKMIQYGDYKNGPECYEIAKKILVKHGFGYLLDETSDIIGNPEPAYLKFKESLEMGVPA